MTKKTILIIMALVLMLATFTACTDNSIREFKPVEMPQDKTIVDNGGVAVQCGEYTYFANGSVEATEDNTYGKVEAGSICRILTADIGKEDAKIELVVPKIFYKGNADSTGLYIFGDRIYFTTPGVEKNNNGELKSGELSVISAKLTGEDVKIHFTFGSNENAVFFMENGSDLHAVYMYSGNLYNVNLTTNKSVKVAENITAVKGDANAVYALQKITYTDSKDNEQSREYNNVLKYTVGDSEAQVVLKGAEADNDHKVDLTYALVRVDNGKLYYTATNSYVGYAGTFCLDGSKEIRLSANSNTSFLPYKDGILMLNGSFICYIVYDENTGNVTAEKLVYASSFTPVKLDGDTLYFSNSNKLYKATIKEGEIDEEPIVLTTSSMSDSKLSFDIIGDAVFFIESSNKKMTHAVIDEDDKIVETTLAFVYDED